MVSVRETTTSCKFHDSPTCTGALYLEGKNADRKCGKKGTAGNASALFLFFSLPFFLSFFLGHTPLALPVLPPLVIWLVISFVNLLLQF